MCAMWFPESDVIARDHPELAEVIDAVDRYLGEMAQVPFRLGPTADLLGIAPRTLARLLRLYEAGGIIEPIEVYLCPEDDNLLEENEDGALWCDLCEGEYEAEACEREVAYQVRPDVTPRRAPRAPAIAEALGEGPPMGLIRKLLLAAFTPEMLRRFCTDRPMFREVVNEFGPGQGLDDMVDRVMEYCRTRLLWETLLAAVKEENPRQYERFEGKLGRRRT
jgi:DNA-binding Lrp family transcriptional regulator